MRGFIHLLSSRGARTRSCRHGIFGMVIAMVPRIRVNFGQAGFTVIIFLLCIVFCILWMAGVNAWETKGKLLGWIYFGLHNIFRCVGHVHWGSGTRGTLIPPSTVKDLRAIHLLPQIILSSERPSCTYVMLHE